MKFNALKFYQDFRINYATSGNKHCLAGWVQIHCPFCTGSRDYHLGFHISSGAYNCWRCGTHGQIDVVKALLHCSYEQARETVKQYRERSVEEEQTRKKKRNVSRFETVLPPEAGELSERHKKYLVGRNYDVDRLVSVWGLKGTGPVGRYKHRILAPIYFRSKLVSYQGRDITNKSELKYKACAKEDEAVEHQTILYGYDYAIENDACIVVEGIADVWRLGKGAVSCFGTSFTMEQVNLLIKSFYKVYILFDSDDANAIIMAEQLASLLSAAGKSVEILELDEGDPGEMKQSEADQLMLELGLEGYKEC